MTVLWREDALVPRVTVLARSLSRFQRTVFVRDEIVRPGDILRLLGSGETVRVEWRRKSGGWAVERSLGTVRRSASEVGSEVCVVANAASRRMEVGVGEPVVIVGSA